jgi:hypothetical protein
VTTAIETIPLALLYEASIWLSVALTRTLNPVNPGILLLMSSRDRACFE